MIEALHRMLALATRRNIRSRMDLVVYVTRMTLYVGVMTSAICALQAWYHDPDRTVLIGATTFLAGSVLCLPITWEFGRMYLDLWQATQTLQSLARTDLQTGLLNNRTFIAHVEERLAGGRSLALLLGDLDRFKTINDRHGHPKGDEVIAAVGTCLRDLFGDNAVLGRMGGEEYAVAIDCPFHDPADSRRYANAFGEELRRRVAALEIATDGDELSPTISIGVAMSSEPNGFSDLYSRADAALYRAKAAGRNRVVDELAAPHTVAPQAAGRSPEPSAEAGDARDLQERLAHGF